MIKKCKTCNFWEPFNAVCFSAYSDERGDITDSNYRCDSWEPHECPQCGGALEAREEKQKIWYECDCGYREDYNPTDMSAGRDVSDCGVFVDRNLIGEMVDSNGNVHYEDIMKLPTLSLGDCQQRISDLAKDIAELWEAFDNQNRTD